ncbi:hydroxycarboxylic acid receptor 2-like [Amia ocellicauda]|uniref:hydroxycarboxylic acid receptor 2-like n=1 Tax=Amia ocellicauda TaxID=2972642 RepID=UPI003463B23B
MAMIYANSTLLNYSTPNITDRPWTPFLGCEEMLAGILFGLAIQIINVLLGIPANMMVLWLLVRNTGESSTSDIFIFNLALLDGFFGILVPLDMVNVFFLNDKQVWGAQMFAYGVKDMGGPLFLSCMCLDRYLAVLYPITFTGLKDHKYRAALSAVALAFTLAYAIAKTIGGISHFEKIFTVIVLTTFAFMVFCNISILWALKRSGPGKDEMHPMKKKAFKMVLSILAILVFNYLPPVALFPFQVYYSADVFRCYIQPIAFSFVNISSSTQPLIYLSRVEKIPWLTNLKKNMCCSEETPCS